MIHGWNLTPAEARALQEEQRGRVILEDRFDEIHTVAGLDVHFDEEEHAGLGGRARAAVATLQLPDLAVLEEAVAESPLAFPLTEPTR